MANLQPSLAVTFKKLVYLGLLILPLSCQAAEPQTSYNWQPDGTVSTPANKKLDSGLDVVTTAKEFNGQLFLAGYVIAATGENIPSLALIKKDGSIHPVEPLQEPVTEFFEYQQSLRFVTESGAVYQWLGSLWQLDSLKLKPGSRVIHNKTPLLACYPSNPVKSKFQPGQCYTTQWQQSVNWVSNKPQVCDGELVVVDDVRRKFMLKAYSVGTGELQSSAELEQQPKADSDLCELYQP